MLYMANNEVNWVLIISAESDVKSTLEMVSLTKIVISQGLLEF